MERVLDITRRVDGVHATSVASVADYVTLLKPRVMSLVVFTAWVGLMASPLSVHPVLAWASVIAVAMAAAGAGAINMWYDRDIDSLMKRTQGRPIPRGVIDPLDGLGLGVLLSCMAVTLMFLAVNMVAALMLVLSIGFYVFVYTMGLKRRTPQNIVIGGAAGAFPPIIGWVSTGADITLYPLLMFLIIFLWTPPHFWALALVRMTDYQRSDVPMLPAIKGRHHTKKAILFYTCLLLLVTLLLPWFGFVGRYAMYGLFVLNGIFLAHALAVYRRDTTERCLSMFRYSIVYLFLLFMLILGDSLW
ncbi:MAG: protoheme IX farnesyltransferase [Alphaproteobacteria bacterium GM7ARS4]|nr:protoheme IX farnesyltransferase [Alphaproteobacteria bacterium GM7ARS4]